MATSRVLVAPDPSHLAPRSFLRPHDFLLPYILEWEGDTDAQVAVAMAQQSTTSKTKSPGKTKKGKADADSSLIPVTIAPDSPPGIDLEHCVVCGVSMEAEEAEEEGDAHGTTAKGKKGKEKRARKVQAEKAEKKHKKAPPAPWCRTCQTARTRLNARYQFQARGRPNTTRAPCALCGSTATVILAVDQIFSNPKKASAFGDPAGWVRRDTAWVCLPCASVYAVTGVKVGKLGAFTFALAPDGSLDVQLNQQIPWWDAPPAPCLVVYHRGQTGGAVQRLARTEVSLDPDTVVINIIDSTDRYPTRLTFPRASPDMQTEIHRTVAALAAMIPVSASKGSKKEKYPPEFWILLKQFLKELMPHTAPSSPHWQETSRQLVLQAQRRRATHKEGL